MNYKWIEKPWKQERIIVEALTPTLSVNTLLPLYNLTLTGTSIVIDIQRMVDIILLYKSWEIIEASLKNPTNRDPYYYTLKQEYKIQNDAKSQIIGSIHWLTVIDCLKRKSIIHKWYFWDTRALKIDEEFWDKIRKYFLWK